MSYLSGLLALDRIALNMRGRAAADVLRELAARVPELRADTPRLDLFVEALLERERLHSTAIGGGIALPHARCFKGGIIARPLLVFGRHETGIPFSAADQTPVRIFFLLAAPDLTEHLRMLSSLSRVLRDAALRASLLESRDPSRLGTALAEAEARLAKAAL